MTLNSSGRFRVRASAIWIGGPSSAARRRSTSARFSPACLRPVKKSAIRLPSLVATMPDVKIPVRSAESLSPPEASLCFGSPTIFPPFLPFLVLLHQVEDLHGRIVVVEDVALRGLLDELAECRPDQLPEPR